MQCRSDKEELRLELLEMSDRSMNLTCCASDDVQNSIHGKLGEIRDRLLHSVLYNGPTEGALREPGASAFLPVEKEGWSV